MFTRVQCTWSGILLSEVSKTWCHISRLAKQLNEFQPPRCLASRRNSELSTHELLSLAEPDTPAKQLYVINEAQHPLF